MSNYIKHKTIEILLNAVDVTTSKLPNTYEKREVTDVQN